jgi:anti-sigma-K factor RskA
MTARSSRPPPPPPPTERRVADRRAIDREAPTGRLSINDGEGVPIALDESRLDRATRIAVFARRLAVRLGFRVGELEVAERGRTTRATWWSSNAGWAVRVALATLIAAVVTLAFGLLVVLVRHP